MTKIKLRTISKLVKINLIIICLVGFTGKYQNQVLANNQMIRNKPGLLQATKTQGDTINPKDLKVLSTFGDTLILHRFLKEIEAFEKDDSIHANRKIDIVFTGSSSIRKWKTLQNDMDGLNVLNRAFGGSTIPEIIYYSDSLIYKHKPKQVVLYAGENDISTTKTDSSKVFDSFVYFQKLLKQKLPDTELFFISIKLSPARTKYWSAIQSINKMIEKYCKVTTNCKYIDVNKAMLDSENRVRKDLYLKDKLHLNKEGYQIWSKIISLNLKKQNK